MQQRQSSHSKFTEGLARERSPFHYFTLNLYSLTRQTNKATIHTKSYMRGGTNGSP